MQNTQIGFGMSRAVFFFNCATEVLLRRSADGEFVELSTAPMTAQALVSLAASEASLLQRAVLSAWRENTLENKERGWASEGSVGDLSSSSSDADSTSESSDSQSSSDCESASCVLVGTAAADLFKSIEDFVPAEEAHTPMKQKLSQ